MKKERFLIKNVRCVYPSLDTPRAFDGQTEEQAKYGIKILIPKAAKGQLAEIKANVTRAIDENGDWSATVKKQVTKTAFDADPYNDNCILKDGDAVNARRIDEGKTAIAAYAGMIVLGANRNRKGGAPTVKDRHNVAIPSGMVAGEILSGYWINLYVEVYLYSKPKQGATLSLLGVQKVKEDEVFGREDAFEALDEDEDDDKEGAFDE